MVGNFPGGNFLGGGEGIFLEPKITYPIILSMLLFFFTVFSTIRNTLREKYFV